MVQTNARTSVLTLCVVIFVTGCASVEKGFTDVGHAIGETYNEAEEAIREAFADRGNRYCLQAAGVGMLGGAAVGAGIGYAATGSATAAAIGAAAGGVAGAFAGCQYGVWVADRRESYESESARLDEELKNATDTNDSLVELNEALRADLGKQEEQLAQLKSMKLEADQKRIAKEKMAKEVQENRKGVEEQLVQAEKELAIHRETLAQLQNAPPSPSASKGELKDIEEDGTAAANNKALMDLDTKGQPVDTAEKIAEYKRNITEMKKAIAELRSLNEQYAKADSRVAAL